eukprot:snap_masked-scaffold1635_size32709-processed-gene-0.7 protein:Tk07229 transcript:snap_masked-scaffold1635_size32709-processed-gene-0.7-mRNA-1 annotation:"lysosomal trafficking"
MTVRAKPKGPTDGIEVLATQPDKNPIVHVRPLRLDEVIALWRDVQSRYDAKALVGRSPSKRVKRRRMSRARQSLSPPAALGRSPSSLRSASSTSSGPDEDLVRDDGVQVLKSYPPYPMDFDYFEQVIRSDDESRFQIEWKRLRESKSFRHEKCEPVDESAKIPDIPDDQRVIHEGQFALIILHLLTRICRIEVSRRRLRSSFDLSLSLTTFAADVLLRFRRYRSGFNASISLEERFQLELGVMKLLLTALTELQFNANYQSTLSQNQVPQSCLWVLEQCVQRCEESSPSEEIRKVDPSLVRATLQAGASILHVIQSFHTFSQRFLPAASSSSSPPKTPLGPKNRVRTSTHPKCQISSDLFSLYNEFCTSNGPHLLSRILHWSAKQISSAKSFPDGVLFFRELNAFFQGTEEARDSLSKNSVSSLSQLYVNMTKAASSLALNLSKKSKPENVAFLGEVLQELQASQRCPLVQLLPCWEHLVNGLQSACVNRKLMTQMLKLIESMVQRHCRREASLAGGLERSHSRVQASSVDVQSDSDSAFCEERSSQGPIPQDKMAFLETYLDILGAEDVGVGELVISHLSHLTRIVPIEQTLKILTKVVVPYLEIKIASCSSEAVSQMSEAEVAVANKCLVILTEAIQQPLVIDFVYQHRVHITVLACNANYHLMNNVYEILEQYLLYQGHKLYASTPVHGAGARGRRPPRDKGEPCSSDEQNLTDEDVFQPGLSKMMGSLSDMRAFHQIITSCSAKVLEKKENATSRSGPNPHFRELAHVWSIQAALIDRFVPYQDYLLMRGLAKTVEDLLQTILQLILLPKLEDQRGFMVASLESFFRILVRLVSRLDEQSTPGPVGVSEIDKILNQGLHDLSLVILDLDSMDVKRRLITALFTAASDCPKECSRPLRPERKSKGRAAIPRAEGSQTSENLENIRSSGCDADDELEGGRGLNRASEARTHPQIIWPPILIFIVELAAKMVEHDPVTNAPVATYSLFKLGRLGHGPARNRNLLQRASLILKILEHQDSFLGEYASRDLQTETMTLLTYFGRFGLGRQEYRAIMATFKRGQAVEPFLMCLKDICSHTCNPFKVRHSLKFPATTGVTSIKEPLLAFPIREAVGSALKTGCTVSLWLKLKCGSTNFVSPDDQSSDEGLVLNLDCVEIFAIGGGSLTLSVTSDGCSLIKVEGKRDSYGESLGVASFNISKRTIPGWNHWVFSFNLRHGKSIDVGAFVNGMELSPLVISGKIPSSFIDQDDIRLTLGQVRGDPRSFKHQMELASLVILNISVINEITAIYLLLCGSNVAALSTRADRPMLLVRHVLSHFPALSLKIIDLDWAMMAQEISKRLLVVYAVTDPSRVVVYPVKAADKTGFLNSLYPSRSESKKVPEGPISVDCEDTFLLTAATVEHWQFSDVVLREGGTIPLALTLARLVELQAKEHCLALALDLLLSVVNGSSECTSDFLHHGGRQLLARILEESQDLLGMRSIAVILNHACSAKLIDVKADHEVSVLFLGQSILCHNFLIDILVSQWKLLKRPVYPDRDASPTFLEVVLQAFIGLVGESSTIEEIHPGVAGPASPADPDWWDTGNRPEDEVGRLNAKDLKNPWSSFNAEVFRQFDIVDSIMKKVHEEINFNGDETESSQADVHFRRNCMQIADLMAKLYGSLVGSPVQIPVLDSLLKNLLLLHDPVLTFVNHSKAGVFSAIMGNNSLSSGRGSRAASTLSLPTLPITSSSSSSSSSSEEERINTGAADEVFHATPQGEVRAGESSRMRVLSNPDYPMTSTNPLERSGPWGEEGPRASETEGSGPKRLRDALLEQLLHVFLLGFRTVNDRMLQRVLTQVVSPDYFLVLLNNPTSSIRVLCLKILGTYLKKSALLANTLQAQNNNLDLTCWDKINGFHQMAFQLQKFEATEEIVDAYLSIVHRSVSFQLENQVEIANRDISHITAQAMIPAMVLLPKTVYSLALAHSFILHLHELFSRSRTLVMAHHQIGLFLALAKTLANLGHTSPETADIVGQDSRDIIANDLHDFLRLIVLRFASFHGKEHFGVVEDLLQHLVFLSREEYLTYGPNSGGTKALRKAFCVVMEETLFELQTKLEQLSSSTNGVASSSRGASNLFGTLQPWDEITNERFLRTLRVAGSIYSEASSSTDLARAAHEANSEYGKPASVTELTNRRYRIIEHAVEFLLATEPTSDGSLAHLEGDETLEPPPVEYLVKMLVSDIKSSIEVSKSSNRDIQTQCRLLLKLLNFQCSPRFSLRFRMQPLRYVCTSVVKMETLERIFQVQPAQSALLGVFLQDVRVHHKADLADDERIVFHQLHALFQGKNMYKKSTTLSSSGDISGVVRYELDQIHFQETRARQFYYEGNREYLQMARKDLSKRSEKVNQSAVSVTHSVMKVQDEARKVVIAGMKADLAKAIKGRQLCEEIVHSFTHERAIWHFREKYPQSWALSEVEGAQRMRIRLERRYSRVDPKFYLEEHRFKAKRDSQLSDGAGPDGERPFAFLTRYQADMSSILIENLNSDDHIRFMDKAVLVVPEEEVHGEILLSQSQIYFVERGSPTSGSARLRSFTWTVERLREIHLRWYQLTDNALELFLASNVTRFLVFDSKKTRAQFIRGLRECRPHLSDLPDPEEVMKLWQNGTITNFDYLMQLNKLAGRTFNDLMQYPIYPFILSDYVSETLDLGDPDIYRDLRKPISIQNPLKQERFEANYEATQGTQLGPYHYGSHYSNSGIVLHFLIRLPPFTEMFLRYQDGHFDIPDRSFHTLRSTWILASSDSSTDVKELIPDLFTLPELLTNDEGFDMGQKQTGEPVRDVALPPWAQNDPRLFIKIHRQALESTLVRESICHWIDLVFGHKQKGKPAVDSINVFFPATYYGFDLNSIQDPVEREARATMVRTYGQTPKQLFDQPHPLTTLEWSKRHQAATHPQRPVPQVLDHVKGLRWGFYVGSPSQTPPKVQSRLKKSGIVANFVVSNSNTVSFGSLCIEARMSSRREKASDRPIRRLTLICMHIWGFQLHDHYRFTWRIMIALDL